MAPFPRAHPGEETEKQKTGRQARDNFVQGAPSKRLVKGRGWTTCASCVSEKIEGSVTALLSIKACRHRSFATEEKAAALNRRSQAGSTDNKKVLDSFLAIAAASFGERA